MPRIKDKYQSSVVPELMKEFDYTSVMEVPKIEKIVVNMGLGDAVQNPKVVEDAVNELTLITGQKPVITKARKSISNFKLREGMIVGAKVTLRGEKMYYFFDKLVSIALPRVRDFRGLSKDSFDGRGNYTLGVREQLIFPEIKFDDVKKVRGMDIVIVTTAKTDQEGRALLAHLGMPFKK
ncbi:MAG: 50S ribosomal protein L5 [Acholeplasmataceae bacterium]|jgi:large subunit ribosomal protein L5